MDTMSEPLAAHQLRATTCVLFAVLGLLNTAAEVESAQPKGSATAEVVGVGILLDRVGTNLTILAVLPGSPAKLSGTVQPGDVVVGIGEGEQQLALNSPEGKSLEECRALTMGPAGSFVTLKILPRQMPAEASNFRIVSLRRAAFKITGQEQFDRSLQAMLEQLPLTNAGDVTLDVSELTRVLTQGHDELLKELVPTLNLHSDVRQGTLTGTSLVEAIQPEYPAWRRITNGMKSDEVLAVLGEPRRRSGGLYGSATIWDYGGISFQSEVFPIPLSFRIFFKDGKVIVTEDPFGGQFSKDGAPTQPALIVPFDNQTFSHYPRFLDLRWSLASGTYPLEYILQIDILRGDGWKSEELRTTIPYHCFVFGGMNKGRCRVRAINALGQSEWSDYRYFNFLR